MLSQIDVQPTCIIEAKVIGIMRMIDNDEADDKIIAVATNDMSVNHINGVSELPKHFTLELRSFFEDYTKMENKTVQVGEFQNAKITKEILQQTIIDYKKELKS